MTTTSDEAVIKCQRTTTILHSIQTQQTIMTCLINYSAVGNYCEIESLPNKRNGLFCGFSKSLTGNHAN